MVSSSHATSGAMASTGGGALSAASLLAPSLALLLALSVFPLAYNFWLSFREQHAFLPAGHYVGFANFEALGADPEFWRAFGNGARYAILSVLLQVLLGTAAAVLLNERFPGRSLFRGVLLFPYLVPTVVVVILWKWILDAGQGLANYLLQSAGLIASPVVWLSERYLMTTLIMVSVWQFFPFAMITIAARLETIPGELYQAAAIDGASAFQRFLHITLPELKGTLLTVTLLRLLWMFTKFDTVWLLAGQQSTGKYVETIPVLAFRWTFDRLQAGMGAATASVLLLTLFLFAAVYSSALLSASRRRA